MLGEFITGFRADYVGDGSDYTHDRAVCTHHQRDYTLDRTNYTGDCRKSLAYSEGFLGKSNSSSIKISTFILNFRA
jgi:hypothetical protein